MIITDSNITDVEMVIEDSIMCKVTSFVRFLKSTLNLDEIENNYINIINDCKHIVDHCYHKGYDLTLNQAESIWFEYCVDVTNSHTWISPSMVSMDIINKYSYILLPERDMFWDRGLLKNYIKTIDINTLTKLPAVNNLQFLKNVQALLNNDNLDISLTVLSNLYKMYIHIPE